MQRLPPRHVHLWRLTMDHSMYDIAFWANLLFPDERARADRFRRENDRDFFIWYRGNLRQILASYLGVNPRDLRYRTGRFGKPEVAGPFKDHRIRFSVSHSGNQVMVAIARESEVGVDIEQLRPIPDLSKVADSVLSAREQSLLRSLGKSDRLPAFFSAWVQKEAYLKARGLGLSRPPEDVDVGLVPVERAGLIRDRWDASATECWSLTAWLPSEGYAAALAIEGHDWHIYDMK